MVYSDKLSAYYLKLARSPISVDCFAGEDMRFSAGYEALESELEKARSIHGNSQPDWQSVVDQSEALLRHESKDLRVVAWLTWALYQRESFSGLLAGLGLLRDLCEHHWATVHPLKQRTRIAAFGWLVQRIEPVLAQSFSLKHQRSLFQCLAEQLSDLDQLWVRHLAEQSHQRLVSFEVCPRLVAEVVSAWTGIPLSQVACEHSTQVRDFATDLRARILGQAHAVQALDRSMRAVAAGLNRPDAPVGVFLLVGPSGVGKTETALALAELLYGGERFLTTINMSEYQEPHSLSRLIGAPPGYVGYGEGGVLTEAVRQKPYSVLLLDEVEKARPGVMNLFYQVFDKGRANDGEGREIDFRNTLILMTSNLGSECTIDLCRATSRPTPQALQEALAPLLKQHFKPALLARMRVVPYYPIDGAVLRELVKSKLQRLAQRLLQRQLAFSYCPRLVDYLAERCTHSDSGARYVDQWIDANLLPLVVDRLLEAMARDEHLQRAHGTLDGDGHVICEFA